MTDRSPPRDLSEEVAFWRGFIERWAREKEGPVPPRAWEALTYAQSRSRDPGDEQVQPEMMQKPASKKRTH